MPRAKKNAAASPKTVEPKKVIEPEKPIKSDEKVELNGVNGADETLDEEVEYEEVEYEEVEVEEEEEEDPEEEDEEEEEVEVEVEEEEEEVEEDEESEEEEEEEVDDEVEQKKHAELLALPPHGSEVYFGGISHDTSEEDLKKFCESIGEVTEVRIAEGKYAGDNKGFAFVTFKSKELASKAIEELNNSNFKGKKLKCSRSETKHRRNRLFIGNVPKSWREKDIKKVVMQIGPGVTAVELIKDLKNNRINRGFAFISYYNHACAEYSRQKMTDQKFKLDDSSPTVSWADPKDSEPSSSQVKSVYVRNLPKDITQLQLRKLFEHHGEITKVALPTTVKGGRDRSRIGFVHFSDRSSALKALDSEKYEVDGHVLECSLAKPQADHKPDTDSNSRKPRSPSNYPAQGGYGAPYGSLGGGYGGAGFMQHPAGMGMMPIVLPDGRIAYVMPQPGMQPPFPPSHQRSSRGSSSSRSGGGSGGSGGRRYRPY